MPAVVKRFSLLRRNPALTPEMFSRHYREIHGPLAAAQAGFRQFAYRYEQNHVEADLLGSDDPPFDGITVTFQVPRPDYRQGFFQHADYANVRVDEERLFDLSRTVSLLGEEYVVAPSSEEGAKAIVVCRPADPEDRDPAAIGRGAVRKAICNTLDASSASALGVGQASVAYGELWEIWFASPQARAGCLADSELLHRVAHGSASNILIALAVRELTIF